MAKAPFTTQQSSRPPREPGEGFYREPKNQPQQLEGDFYSQQTGKPTGGKGKFYSRVESDEPEGHFFRDRKTNPPNPDEQGLGKTGRMPNKGVDREVRALEQSVKKRSAKVKRGRGRM